MMLRQPLVVLKITPLLESISNISRDPESHIWGPSGPYQSPETTQDIPNKVVFSLAWFWIVKIILPWPKVIPIPIQALAGLLIQRRTRTWVAQVKNRKSERGLGFT